MEDKRIIDLFFARSELAIEALAAKYGALCRRIAVNILGDAQDAEECVNDTYLGVWNAVPPQKPDPLRSFVCRIARNLSISRYHINTAMKRNSHYDVALEELDGLLCGGTAEEALDEKELSCSINRFLDLQDEKTRVMFVLRYYHACPLAEIASKMGLRPNNVSVRLLRTRDKLREHLREEGYIL
ncbi:MAG: sigma-70 family RNA polymerase sigma factor [Oscillospiraceae bacterium]|nr:sigma-70 family RNA polymerase sigma factor [Oscillospiraceae bacterium]